jgi:signal transduction histidine kinase
LDPDLLLAQPRKTIIEWARQAPGEEQLRVQFEILLREWCQTDNIMLLPLRTQEYVRDQLRVQENWEGFLILRRDGWTTPESLDRRRETPGAKSCQMFLQEHQLGALVVAPSGGPNPSLLLACGQKTSLRPYTYPDIHLLQELIRMMDNILTHSRMAAHVARLERMEAAAMMSRGLAHDLNNLATPVTTFLLHMEPRVAPDTPEADVLRDAKHAVRVMQDYIRESLFFTRQLTPDFQSVVIPDLLQSVLQLTHARAQARGVTVKLGPTAPGPLAADGALIKRLLQNLVFNGIDATPRGGKVTLSCQRHNDSHCSFSVADEGSGVPSTLLSRIFEPYFTTKDTGDEVRGLGLGLAICRKISDLHGGEIIVGATSQGGALFTVKIPVTPQSTSVLARSLSAVSS